MMTTNTFGLVGRSKDKITEAALRINFKISIQLKQKGTSLYFSGNEYLYRITNSGQFSLKIILTGSTNEEAFDSEYKVFKVGSEKSGYKLMKASGNSGTAGDILGLFSSSSLINAVFKTHEIMGVGAFDRNRKKEDTRSGWWYPNVYSRTRPNSSLKQPESLHFIHAHQRKTKQICYTHLNAAKPWFCNVEGQKQYIRTVRMYIKLQD